MDTEPKILASHVLSHINNREALRQVFNFESLSWGAISPTDLDAILELRDQAHVIVEAKREGAPFPRGQSILLERLTRDLIRAGKKVLTIRAHHNCDTFEDVDLGQCEVLAYLDRPSRESHNHKWSTLEELATVRELIDIYLYRWGIDMSNPHQGRRNNRKGPRTKRRPF